MDIETIILILAPFCSISAFIWVGLFFSKSPKAIRVRTIAFKIWATCILIIIVAITIGGLSWGIGEHGLIKALGYSFLMIGLVLLGIKLFWNLIHGKLLGWKGRDK